MTIRSPGRIAAAAAAVALFVVPGTPASAQQGVIVVQGALPAEVAFERVPYGDLNLLTLAGVQILDRRVRRAAEHVCTLDNGRWRALNGPNFERCYWGATDRGRRQMAGAIYRARQFAYSGRYHYYRG